MTLTLPTPVFAPAGRDYNGKPSRSRKVNFFVEGTETDDERVAVQVYVGHSTDRKQFFASVNQVTIRNEPGSPFSSEASWPFNAVTLQRRPVARYSEKALDAFLAEVLNVFPDLVEHTPKIQAFFTDTDGDKP